MKHFLFILISTTFLSSCDLFRNNLDPMPPSIGGVDANLNGEKLTSLFPPDRQVARAAYSGIFEQTTDPVSIYFGFLDSQNAIRASLSWKKLSVDTGRFTIGEANNSGNDHPEVTASFHTIVGGDVSGKSYKVLPSADNYFTLDSYDENTKEMKGTFNVTFVVNSYGDERDFPDTLRLTEGRFQTRLLPRKEWGMNWRRL